MAFCALVPQEKWTQEPHRGKSVSCRAPREHPSNNLADWLAQPRNTNEEQSGALVILQTCFNRDAVPSGVKQKCSIRFWGSCPRSASPWIHEAEGDGAIHPNPCGHGKNPAKHPLVTDAIGIRPGAEGGQRTEGCGQIR